MNTQTLENKIELLLYELKYEAELFIDFLLFKSKPNHNKIKRLPGFLEGKISITDDFDEPLECLKDYM